MTNITEWFDVLKSRVSSTPLLNEGPMTAEIIRERAGRTVRLRQPMISTEPPTGRSLTSGMRR